MRGRRAAKVIISPAPVEISITSAAEIVCYSLWSLPAFRWKHNDDGVIAASSRGWAAMFALASSHPHSTASFASGCRGHCPPPGSRDRVPCVPPYQKLLDKPRILRYTISIGICLQESCRKRGVPPMGVVEAHRRVSAGTSRARCRCSRDRRIFSNFE